MDFVHDALADGRPFRILTVVDQWSRQSPLLEVAARQCVTEVFSTHPKITPVHNFGVTVPDTLYSVAYF